MHAFKLRSVHCQTQLWGRQDLLWATATVILAACHASPPQGVFGCADDNDCPPSQRCFERTCWYPWTVDAMPAASTDVAPMQPATDMRDASVVPASMDAAPSDATQGTAGMTPTAALAGSAAATPSSAAPSSAPAGGSGGASPSAVAGAPATGSAGAAAGAPAHADRPGCPGGLCENGIECTDDAECASGSCLMRCQAPGELGAPCISPANCQKLLTCSLGSCRRISGERCQNDDECTNGSCLDVCQYPMLPQSRCDSEADCGRPATCESGTCKVHLGGPCRANLDCISGSCTGNSCFIPGQTIVNCDRDSNCPLGTRCFGSSPGNSGVCEDPNP